MGIDTLRVAGYGLRIAGYTARFTELLDNRRKIECVGTSEDEKVRRLKVLGLKLSLVKYIGSMIDGPFSPVGRRSG